MWSEVPKAFFWPKTTWPFSHWPQHRVVSSVTATKRPQETRRPHLRWLCLWASPPLPPPPQQHSACRACCCTTAEVFSGLWAGSTALRHHSHTWPDPIRCPTAGLVAVPAPALRHVSTCVPASMYPPGGVSWSLRVSLLGTSCLYVRPLEINTWIEK